MALDTISAIICVNKAGETATIPISEFVSSVRQVQDPTSLSDGKLPKSNQGAFVASGITELVDGQLQFNTYNGNNRFTGKAVGLLAFDSNGKILTYPLTTGPVSSTTAATQNVSGTFNGTAFTVPVYNATGDDLDSTEMLVQNGNWMLGAGGNPFFKFGVYHGSINIDQGTSVDGYRLNGKLVVNVDKVSNEITIGNSVYTTTNIKNIKTDKAIFNAIGGGTISDIAADTTGDFTLIKPAKNGTYALISDINETAWLIGGNTLAAKGLIGSNNAFDIGFERGGIEYFTLNTDGISVLKDITSSGNVTLQKGNPRLRLRDTGAGGHTGGFDLHVNGDEFIIDDNTHSRNILRNYLNSSIHTTDFDAEVFNFKNGATNFARLNATSFNLPYLTPSQLIATDASDNLVSLSTATYPSLAELTYLKGVTSAIQTQINGKFNTPTGLTTNFVTKWNGTALANSDIFDNGSVVNIGSSTATALFGKTLNIFGATSSIGIISPTIQGYIYNAQGRMGIGTGSIHDFDIETSATSRIRVLANGNVGIGTTSPSGRLSVLSTDAGSSSSGFFVFNWDNKYSIFGPNVSSSTGAALALGYSNTDDASHIISAAPNVAWKPLRFASSTFSFISNGNNQGLFQNGTGNVGIGTTSPLTSLNVQRDNTINDLGQFVISGGTNSNKRLSLGFHTTSNYGFMQSLIAGDNYYPLALQPTAGNVGIGTTTPNSRLDVNGNIGFTQNIGSTRYLLISGATNTYTGSLILQSGAGSDAFGGAINLYGHSHATKPGWVSVGISSGAGTVGTANEGRFTINTTGLANGTDLFTVLRGTGNVGIGTTSPQQRQHNNITVGGVGVGLMLSNDATNATAGRGIGVLFAGTGNANLAQIEAQTLTASNNTGGLIFRTANAGTLTERMRIDQNGSLGLGSTALTGVSFRNSKAITGAAVSYGQISDGTIQADVTSQSVGHLNQVNTVASAFTIPNVSGFMAAQGTIGAGSVITNLHGFVANSTIVGGTNNYGFRGQIPAGTNRWNLFMDGTAQNHFRGNVGIGAGSTVPTTELDVIGTTRTTNLRITSGATVGRYWVCTNTDGTGAWTTVSDSYLGTWNASTNSPTIANGTGVAGQWYRVVTAGTWNSITFAVGDDVKYNGTTWQRIPGQGYTLQIATSSVLGGVRVGTGLNIDAGTGILSVAYGTTGTTAAVGNHTHTFTEIQSRPTTIAGYGITDYNSLWETQFSARINGTGLVRANGSTITYDNNSYLTANQNISITGDVSGSGTTAITATLATVTQANTGDFRKVTLDTKGRVTGNTAVVLSDLTSLGAITLTSLTATSPLVYDNATGAFSMTRSSPISNGWLHQDDWNFFNEKQGRISNILGYDENIDNLVLVTENTSFIWKALNKTLVGLANVENTALSSYTGFDSRYVVLSGSYSNPSWITSLAWSKLSGVPSTFTPSAHTLDSHSNVTITSNTNGEILRWNGTAWINNTLAEAGIQPSGNYLTANQTITLSGIITGSGTTSITTSIADGALSIAKTNGLQTALNARMVTASYPDLVSIEALTGTTGLLRKIAANTWSLDNADYQDSSQVSAAIYNMFYVPEDWPPSIEPMMYYNYTMGRMEAMEYAYYDGNYNFTSGPGGVGGNLICGNIYPLGINLGTFGTTGQFIRNNGGTPTWGALVASDIPNLSSIYQPLDADLTAIGGLSGTGFLKRTGTNTWGLEDITNFLTRNYTGTITPNNSFGTNGQVLATTGELDYWISLRQSHINFKQTEYASLGGQQEWEGLVALGHWSGIPDYSPYQYGIKSGWNKTLNKYGWAIKYPTGTYSNYFDDFGRLSYITPDGFSRRYLIEGEGGGTGTSVTPNLQEVSIVGRNSNQRLQYNFVDYALVSDIVTLNQNLDSVLLNGNTANNKNIFLNGLSSAYTLGYNGSSSFYINHSAEGVLNMIQTAGTQFNINAATDLYIESNNATVMTSSQTTIEATGNLQLIGNTMGITIASDFAISANTGNIDLVSNSGFVNIGYYNVATSKTRIGRPDAIDYLFMNGQRYNFRLPSGIAANDYLVFQFDGTNVTPKKATIFASGGRNYLTI